MRPCPEFYGIDARAHPPPHRSCSSDFAGLVWINGLERPARAGRGYRVGMPAGASPATARGSHRRDERQRCALVSAKKCLQNEPVLRHSSPGVVVPDSACHATKLGRGELFECLDVYNYFRGAVFGPLLAVEHDQRPQGVRRLERYAGDALAELEQTVGNHSRDGCLRALRASIRLYQRLRQNADDQSLVRRAEADAASLDYLEEIAASND
jgi:hypothetical protein